MTLKKENTYKFCEKYKNYNKSIFKNTCHQICGIACNQHIFTVNKNEISTLSSDYLLISVYFEENSLTKYISNPSITFDTYFTSIGGLMGLWSGISIMDLRNGLIKILYLYGKKIAIKIKIFNFFRKYKFTIIKYIINKFKFKVWLTVNEKF